MMMLSDSNFLSSHSFFFSLDIVSMNAIQPDNITSKFSQMT